MVSTRLRSIGTRRLLNVGLLLLATVAAVAGPGPVLAAGPQFSDVGAGGFFSCGIASATGQIQCWGYNNLDQSTPPAGNFKALDTGLNHSCAIRTADGTVACWGYNPNGQASPPGGSYAAVSGGAYHSCGIRSSDAGIDCWGDDTFGEVGSSRVDLQACKLEYSIVSPK